jgi:nucleosome binding factor SPN SPT16 subunit
VTLMPTVHCLVQLVEPPYTVVPLGDVEIVNLERVGFNGKTFDLVIVFKDFDRETLMIGSIPAQSLDDIKNWLTTQDIKFFESKLNLQWKQILKTIVADPDEFMQTVRVSSALPHLSAILLPGGLSSVIVAADHC